MAAYLVGAKFGGLTNAYMTPEERADLDVHSVEHYNRVMGSKVQVIGWSLYAAILWCLKVCVTALYGRLTYEYRNASPECYRYISLIFFGRTGINHLEIRVKMGYGILLVTYLAVALTILCSFQPFHHFWQVSPDPGQMCQATNSPAYVLTVLVLNIITDAYLLSIPLPVRLPGNDSSRKRALFLLTASSFFGA